jgi:intracellular multiplication protein IcmB
VTSQLLSDFGENMISQSTGRFILGAGSLGPVELWAISTTPNDVGLRTRLYERIGPGEARRRFACVFPNGTAKHEVIRRKDERLRRGEDDSRAQVSVFEELADELINGRGLGIMLRESQEEPGRA